MAELVIATRSGKILVVDEDDIALDVRDGRGAKIAGLRPGDSIAAVARVPDEAELTEQAESLSSDGAEVDDDIRQAVIDVLATRMPHLREHAQRAWSVGAQRTLAEMAEDQQLRFLVAERGVINSRLSSVGGRTTENFSAREAIDTRVANRVVHLFRSKA